MAIPSELLPGQAGMLWGSSALLAVCAAASLKAWLARFTCEVCLSMYTLIWTVFSKAVSGKVAITPHVAATRLSLDFATCVEPQVRLCPCVQGV